MASEPIRSESTSAVSYVRLCYITDFLFSFLCASVGPIYVNTSVPKMEDVEREMSREFNGWVSNG